MWHSYYTMQFYRAIFVGVIWLKKFLPSYAQIIYVIPNRWRACLQLIPAEYNQT